MYSPLGKTWESRLMYRQLRHLDGYKLRGGGGGRENEEGEEKGTWPARGTKKKYASRLEVPPGREWSVGGTLNLRATAFPSFALSLRL